ncbi:hypothetical protein [Phycicoccus sp. Soil748]|uniref:hypothetical protein n=1 Tax=Phycicoccus sp. Soil748 TaxID=1736397 RepID=UPI000703583B|nr:hypothetical protein [Phycicoccus sp. Soil748]KRE57276.1 hypothetical protein ASG70_02425 [Phycicoccus sp. Soil748]
MTPSSEAASQRVADPTLFTGLVDDAAVFPPGNAPLGEAVRRHRFHRAAAYAPLVGPLLVPVADAGRLETVVASTSSAASPPLEVALVARPGVTTAETQTAVTTLVAAGGVTPVGVEMAWSPQWRDAQLQGLPLTLEVDRDEHQAQALDDLRRALDEGLAVQAKFRTGATPTWPWPTEQELAAFVAAAVRREVPFKLTGGLHHLVRGTRAEGEQHGLLNVLLAVHRAVAGDGPDLLTAVLADRADDDLARRAGALAAHDVASIRRSFTAYGCCEVTDPISELMTRRLIQGA